MKSWKIVNSELCEWSAKYDGAPFHAVLCDPPYNIGFMGKAWDTFTNALDSSMGYYVAGLTDGEGCFRISRHNRSTGNVSFACHFQIKLRRDDKAILERVQTFFGVGRIEEISGSKGSKPQVIFIVETKDGCDRVRNVFNRFRLRAKKARDFAIWSVALDAWIEQERGNRWSGPSVKTKMKDAWLRLKNAREYQERPWSGDPFQDQVREWGLAIKRHLYPGAIVLMFSGTRMWHRLAAGMEDAGFHLWDTLMWLYGEGFPKAQAIDMLIDKQLGVEREVVGTRVLTGNAATPASEKNGTYGVGVPCVGPTEVNVTVASSDAAKPWSGHKTAQLKPAWEPVLCFRLPSEKTYADLAAEYGSGALNIDGCRIGSEAVALHDAHSDVGYSGGYKNDGRERGMVTGRYPANVALECTCENVEVGVEPAHSQVVAPKSTVNCYVDYGATVYPRSAGQIIKHTDPRCPAYMLDAQGEERGVHTASRFFYCAKASRGEREVGLEGFADEKCGVGALRDNGRGKVARNVHPTVKPIALNKWLSTLVLPPDGVCERRILVPFAGVASEMTGCLLAGWDFVYGVEMNPDYVHIGSARLKHWSAQERIPEVHGETEVGEQSESSVIRPAQTAFF